MYVVTFDGLKQRLEDTHKVLSPTAPLSSDLDPNASAEDDDWIAPCFVDAPVIKNVRYWPVAACRR